MTLRAVACATATACALWTAAFAASAAVVLATPGPAAVDASAAAQNWAAQTWGTDPSALFVSVAGNNLKVAAVNLSGAVTFGLTTFSNLAVNGLASGFIFGTASRNGVDLSTLLSSTLPHAIEVVAIWLSGGVGFLGARTLFDGLRAGRFPPVERVRVLVGAALLSGVIVVLAAWLEAFVSVPSQPL